MADVATGLQGQTVQDSPAEAPLAIQLGAEKREGWKGGVAIEQSPKPVEEPGMMRRTSAAWPYSLDFGTSTDPLADGYLSDAIRGRKTERSCSEVAAKRAPNQVDQVATD
jgi:hypothetical protein